VSTSVSVPVVKPYVLMDDMVESGDMATSDTVGSTSRELPMLQTVGTAPGSAGSRAALLPHPSSVQPTNPAPQAKTLTLEEAIHVIQAAATAGKTFSFEQKNPKTVGSQSYRRYELYKYETTFAGLDALTTSTFPGTRKPVLHLGATAKSGDFANDVARGYVTFVEPTVPPLGAPATRTGDLSKQALSATPVKARIPQTLRSGSPAHACARHQKLSHEESNLLATLRAWHAPAAAASQRAYAANYCVPMQIVRAAVAETTNANLLEDGVDDSKLLFDIRSGDRGMNADLQPTLPRTFAKLREENDWLTGILPAMKK